MEEFIQQKNQNRQIIPVNNMIIVETRKIMEETVGYINKTVSHVNYLNIEEIVNHLKQIIEKAQSYNTNLNIWFDDEFTNDKQKLFEIINNSDTEFKSYESKNMMIVSIDE